MPVSLRCPHCSTVMQAADSSVGQKVRCPKCQQVLLVAAPRPASTPAALPKPPAPAAPPPRPASPPAAARQPAPVVVPAPPARPVSIPAVPPRKPTPVAPPPRQVTAAPPAPPPSQPIAVTPQPGRSGAGLRGPLPWLIAGGAGAVLLLGATVLWAAISWLSPRAASTTSAASTAAEASLSAPTTSTQTPRGKEPAPAPQDGQEQNPQAGIKDALPDSKEPVKGELEPLPPLQTAADDPPDWPVPFFWAQLASLEHLHGDVRLLLATFGKDREMEEMVARLKKEISTEGTGGLDTAQPWGLYVRVSERGDVPTLVVVLPVRNEAAFHRLLRDLGLQEQAAMGDLTPLRLPPQGLASTPLPPNVKLPEQMYLRISGGHAHICVAGDPNLLVGTKLLSAASLFRPGRDKLLTATARLDHMPRAWQDQLIAGIRQTQKQLVPPGSAPTGKQADLLARTGAAQVESIVKDARSLTLEVGLDRDRERLAADLYFQGKKDSNLAAALADMGGSTSLFGELLQQDVAFGALVNVGLPRSVRPLLPFVVNQATQSALRDASPEERRKNEPIFNALGEVVAAGELDAAVVLRSRGEGKPASVLGGIKVPNGAALDQLVRDQVAALDDRALRELVDLDADTMEGVKVHRFRAQGFFTPSLRTVFGDNPFTYAFRSDALFFTAGAQGKESLTRALPLRPRPSPLALLTLNLRHMHHCLALQPADKQLAGRLLSEEHPGRLRLELSGGQALRLHLALELAVLRFVAAHGDALPIHIQKETR